jgi:hypothetical protein
MLTDWQLCRKKLKEEVLFKSNITRAQMKSCTNSVVNANIKITLPPVFSMGRRPLMGGNWKLNPRKVSDAVGLATEVRKISMFRLM